MKIALVTDSTADIPPDLVERYQISVVPNILIIEGKSLNDGLDITREEFYERLPSMQTFPTTSTASSGAYEQVYRGLLQQGAEQILSIHVSQKFSGIYNAANTAAITVGENIQVIDSDQLTLGMGFQVLAAAEAIDRGAEIRVVIEEIENVRRRVHVIAMLDTLEYLARSGRVSWARARIGNFLRIKPFIEVVDGEARRLGDVRTRRKGIERLKEMLRDLGPLDCLAVLHTNAEYDARQFLDDITFDNQLEPSLVNVTTVIGAHVGPHGLGFAAVTKNK